MDVIVRNLADQATESQVRNFFRTVLEKFGIHTFHFQKLKNRGCATITFVDKSKAYLFLQVHGQNITGHHGFKMVLKKLYLHERQVRCMESTREPDRHLLLALEKEESDRYAAISRKLLIVRGRPTPVEPDQRAFDIFEVRCGQWAYQHGGDLAFTTEFAQHRAGRLIFTHYNVFIKIQPSSPHEASHQIDIPYRSIQSFTIGTQSYPCITFSLFEAPRLFEELDSERDGLITDNSDMMLRNVILQENKPSQTFKRKRITALGKAHENVVASCLCYRFLLSNPLEIKTLKQLKRFPEIPDSMVWDTKYLSRSSFTVHISNLNTALSGIEYGTMPFDVKFQLQRLSQNGYLHPSRVIELMAVVNQRLNDGEDVRMVATLLRKLAGQIPFAGPDTEAADVSLQGLRLALDEAKRSTLDDDSATVALADQYDHISDVHKAMVTPAGVYLYGPGPETKNRVTRKYSQFPNHFLSVSFLDEDGEQFRCDRQTSGENIYYGRFKRVLEGIINIAGRGYEFLGFSNSSLRSQTCWFMAPFVLDGNLIHARAIIGDLGDFSMIRSPAKCAARIGQAFSQTLSSIKLPLDASTQIPDVVRNGRTFSDGCGTCSPAIINKIWQNYALARALKPTILQIRYQGAKGVLSLDNRLSGMTLNLRPSMIKFTGTNAANIEICGAAHKPLPMYLNRQLIKILEDLGVPDQSFLTLQSAAVEQLRRTTLSSINASTFLERSHIGKAAKFPWLIRKLWDIGFTFTEDNFLRDIVEMAVLIQLREIKHRTRILINSGVTLYGIMDETGYLQENEIYCIMHNDSGSHVIEGDVVITRSPALHPGDVQCVNAVNAPPDSALRALHNVVVFSSHGARDLPSQLSGGDLDGDIYNIIWDRSLYPTKRFRPADYPTPPAIDIGRPVQRPDITDFFVSFMKNENLGYIATLHQILADQRDEGTFDPVCLLLAGMHSTAVDFSKTGIPVEMKQMPKYSKARPDFQAPGPRVLIEKSIAFEDPDSIPSPHENGEVQEAASYGPQKLHYYESPKILGQLYRAIDEHQFFAKLQAQSRPHGSDHRSLADAIWLYVKEKTAYIQWQYHLEFAKTVKENYEDNLVDTMFQYSNHPSHHLDEIEVCSGSILGVRGAQSKRQREFSVDMKEKYERDVAFTVRAITHGEGEDGTEEALEKSIACLSVACNQTRVRKRVGALVSFVWVAAAVCLREVEKLPGGLLVLR